MTTFWQLFVVLVNVAEGHEAFRTCFFMFSLLLYNWQIFVNSVVKESSLNESWLTLINYKRIEGYFFSTHLHLKISDFNIRFSCKRKQVTSRGLHYLTNKIKVVIDIWPITVDIVDITRQLKLDIKTRSRWQARKMCNRCTARENAWQVLHWLAATGCTCFKPLIERNEHASTSSIISSCLFLVPRKRKYL